MDRYLEGVIDRLEGEKAVIKIQDGQELLWPLNNLPTGLKEGSAVKIYLSDLATEEIKQENLAKNILRQILKSDAGT